MKIIDHILMLFGVIIIAVIGILFFSTHQKDSDSNSQFRWPSSPEIASSKPDTSYTFENLLADGPGLDAINRHCTNCHSTRLIIQNRMSRLRWEDNIRWMQETQGLWDLGRDHTVVLDYLSTNYAPQQIGRRSNLESDKLEWYLLE